MRFNISLTTAVLLLSSAVYAMPANNNGRGSKLVLNGHSIYTELIPLIREYYTLPQGQDGIQDWNDVKIDLFYALGGSRAYQRERSCRLIEQEILKSETEIAYCAKHAMYEELEEPATSMKDIRYIEIAFQLQGGEYGTITVRSNYEMTSWEKPVHDPKPLKKNIIPGRMYKYDFKDAVTKALPALKQKSPGLTGFSSVVLLPPGAGKTAKGEDIYPYYIFQNWKPKPKKENWKTPSDVSSHPTLAVVGAWDMCLNKACQNHWIAPPEMRLHFNLETQIGWQKEPLKGPEIPPLVGNDKVWR